jgi:hypothetical protein
MTFEKVHSETDCNCLSKAVIDTSSEFVRKLRKGVVEDKDFLTHWDREIIPEEEDCDTICAYRGLSVNQITPEFENQIVEKYKTTFNINPKKGAHYLKFKLQTDAGKVQYTPEEDDKSHYNLFKSDNFSLEKIVMIETVKFV